MSDVVKKQDDYLTDEFLENIVEDTKINDFNIKEECRTVVNKTQRYIEELYRFRLKLKKVEAAMKVKKGDLFKYYKTDYEIKITSSSDIMIFVERDKEYRKIKKVHDELEIVVKFLEDTIKNMGNKSWVLQKMIDAEKIGI
jgi:chaperonin cofactor prefoldin